MASTIQPSFSSGELAPAAQGRVDLAKYQTGLKTLRNMLMRVHGGVLNRPGTEFIQKCEISSEKSRLIPFIFSTSQAYALVFGGGKMLVVKDGGLVLESNKTISAVSNTTPIQITSTAHDYSNGDRVYISGTGIPSIDGVFWIISGVTANTFTLNGSTAPGVVSSVGVVARVFELTIPYTVGQLPSIRYAQLNDVMTLVNSGVRPKDLSRMDHAAWTLTDTVFEQGPIQEINVTTTKTMQASAATGAGVTITAVGHTPFKVEHVGMLLYLEQQNYAVPWEVAKSITAGDIRRSDGKNYTANTTATTGGVRPTHDEGNASDGGVEWAFRDNGYGVATITGFTSSTVVTVTVLNTLPASVVSGATYKWALGAWGGDRGWPSAITYFQQRRMYAATPSDPSKIWASGTDAFTFFGKSSPIVDDDALTLTLASNQQNAIRHLVALGKLIALTAGGKWVIPDDDNNKILTPSKRSAKAQGSVGSSEVAPVTVDETVIYIADKGQTIQDIAYQFASDAFAGNDLSVLSKHLLEGLPGETRPHTIVAAAYQHVPFQCMWMVRDDGVLLGLTYLKEHQVWGWHRHDTDGFFEDVCVIPEGNEDRVYLIVRRTINGQTERYIERMAKRLFSDIKDAHFVDSGLTYDGRKSGGTTVTLSGGITWSDAEDLVLTASAAYFTVHHLNDEIHLNHSDGQILRLSIIVFTDSTHVTVRANHTVPVELRSSAQSVWGHAKKTFSNLSHLEGKTVVALADGKVERPSVSVTNGVIVLSAAAVVVHIGLSFNADFETLAINVPQQGSMRAAQKLVYATHLLVDETRSLMVGSDANNLTEFMQRDQEHYDEPVDLLTGMADVRIPAVWNEGGQVFVRQADPLPLSILTVIPEFDVGGTK